MEIYQMLGLIKNKELPLSNYQSGISKNLRKFEKIWESENKQEKINLKEIEDRN